MLPHAREFPGAVGMKRLRFAPIALVLFLIATASARQASTAPSETYTNPLHVDVADPFVLRHDKTYYLYGTAGSSTGYRVWTSLDLVHWKDAGQAFRKSAGTWGEEMFW